MKTKEELCLCGHEKRNHELYEESCIIDECPCNEFKQRDLFILKKKLKKLLEISERN